MTDVSEELGIRFSEFLDGEMTAEEASDFEAELAGDEALAKAFEQFSETLNVLGGLGAPQVELGKDVQTKIRRRSQGRYFGTNSLRKQRVQTEIFIAIALILLAGIALMATPGGLKALLGPTDFELVEEPEVEGEDGSPSEHGGEDSPSGEGELEGSDPIDEENEQASAGPSLDQPTSDGPLEDAPTSIADLAAGEPPGAPAGATSGNTVMPMAHHEFHYTVYSSMPADALGRRLRDQFGADSVREDEDRIILA
ncbi:MAG: hypothetical protein ACJAYU_001259, partial [Bradymonadia bacterium]